MSAASHRNGVSGDGCLAFERVEIRRMPGFPREGFTLEGLSPGINVIHGPNASGKTTTALAMHALLWPATAPPRAALFARYTVGDSNWIVDVDTGHRQWQRDGAPTEPPAIPPAESRDRYMLALSDLLVTHDRGFAEAVVKETAGGYDVRAAASRRFGSPPGRQKVPEALRRARKQLEDARKAHEGLRAEELELETLREDQKASIAARERAARIERILAALAAREEEASAQEALEDFPPWMERLHGNEAEELDALKKDAEEAEEALRQADRDLQDARRRAAEANLPEKGVPGQLTELLRIETRKARDDERTIEETERALEEAKVKRQAEAGRLGERIDTESLDAIDAACLPELEHYAEDAEKLEAEKKALLAERRQLGDVREIPELDRLREGASLLARWLRAPGERDVTHRRGWTLGLLSGALASLAALLLAWIVHPAYTLLLVAAASLLALTVVAMRTRRDLRALRRWDFEALELDPPADWTDQGVYDRFDELQAQIVLGETEKDRNQRRSRLDDRLKEVESASAALEETRRSLVDRYGIPTEASPARLFWLVTRIVSWQAAHGEVLGLEARLAAYRKQLAARLTQLGQRLEPYGYAQVASAAHLDETITDLDRRKKRWDDATRAESAALEVIDRETKRAAATHAARRELFEKLGLDGDGPQEEADVRAACTRHAAFQEARTARVIAQSEREKTEKAVAADPECDPAWPERPPAELEREKDEADAQADQLDTVNDRISRIDERIEQAKRAHDVEQALAARDDAETHLSTLLEEECRAALGNLLADRIVEETRDHDRPQVFHHAREHFVRITQGRYRLELADSDPPAFRAVQTETGEGRSLDELSSGTRVQLLLAVRLAFVESQEGGARLPLIFDEVLANSDDERAEAAVDTAITLAEEGRQIFYLTAQTDEIARWRAALAEAPDLPSTIIDMAEVRRLERSIVHPLPEPLPPRTRPAVAEPAGMSYEEYGRVLGVPGIDPDATGTGDVHLWHLLDDSAELYHLLSLGIESWGALKTLHDVGGVRRLDEDAERAFERSAVAVRCLEAMLRAWRIGRGRPVDRSVLAESGAVSEAFLTGATELAAAVEGDAKKLIDALDERRLKRFRRDAFDRLRTYLEEHGYLDTREPLDSEAVRAHVVAEIGSELQAGHISGDHVERILTSLAALS